MSTKKIKKTIGNIVYTNKNVGFSITIPDNWMEVKKSSYQDLGINDNTLFIFTVNKFTSLTAVFSGFSNLKSFNKFFEKINYDEQFKVLYKGENTNDKINIKQLVIDNNDKKIMHNFCLINDMIINFTINIDTKNRIFDNKELINDSNFKLINELLSTIEVFEPINPPIYVNDIKEEKIEEVEEKIIEIPEEEIIKKTSQLMIETDCKYKRILIPNFYLKYIYNKDNSDVVLSIINNEIYFKGLNDCFRFIKIDKELSNKIEQIINNNMLSLLKMDIDTNTITSNSMMLIKVNNSYSLIDLNNEENDMNLLKDIFEEIVKEIKEFSDIDFNKFDLFPLVEQNDKQEEVEEENDEQSSEDEPFTVELIPSVEQEKVEEENNEESSEDEPFTVELIPSVEQEKVEEELDVPFTVVPIPFAEKEDEVNDEELNTPNVEKTPVPEIDADDQQVILNYDINDFQEYFHNIDGHASFRFLFPNNLGEKVIRDFNVFDIVKEDLIYRVFLFKCENIDKYNAKLDDWMKKNIESNKTTLLDSYTKMGANNNEIKTYILENGKFYKAIYVGEYLIAISGINDPDHLALADIALDNVEIGEDSRAFVESHDRKMRSINILQAQGIPYIDELPVIESSYEVNGKSLDEIAKRAIVLCLACNFASDIVNNNKKRKIKESKKFFNKLLDTYNVKDVMTKDEKLLFDKMDRNLAVQISWQFESYLILLWTLGLVDEIPFPDTLVDPDSVTALVSSCDTYREFISKCSLRDTSDVLDLADLTYRYNWYCVESKINEEEPVMNPEIVMERHRALNWLLSDVKWDKVEINT